MEIQLPTLSNFIKSNHRSLLIIEGYFANFNISDKAKMDNKKFLIILKTQPLNYLFTYTSNQNQIE